ncbi:MAG: serine acetyltransferase [Proteobacteria bacterium]|nr:serine acetyltransferase [Pseudomonadota bacterium]
MEKVLEVDKKSSEAVCRTEADITGGIRSRLSGVIEDIIESCDDKECYTHIEYHPIPSVESVVEILNKLKEIIFPGYFSRSRLDPVNMKYNMGQFVSVVFDLLSEQIGNSIRHECFRYNSRCSSCIEQAQETTLAFFESVPSIRRVLGKDVRATYEGDPAAQSYDEVIFSYPGLLATTVHRIAHRLYELKVPLLPRTMSEYAHSVTGIDIHPGATIGDGFVIDHGTGVVVGETTIIGNNVRIYQGVTLGAHSLPRDAGERMKGKKRHPTIEDEVIIYSGATILGGDTVIGTRSVIGGNVWLTKSVPPDTKVMMEAPGLIYNQHRNEKPVEPQAVFDFPSSIGG